jgi:diguanylate cyclase (GGDEF)-like protein
MLHQAAASGAEDRERELLDVNEQLLHMSQTDVLTGLDNRRHLEHRLEEMFAHARRFKEPIACVICDLDRFKAVNDTYGHPAGDEVLKQFAQILRGEARSIGRVGRFGGEEFMFLLPGAGTDAAGRFADRVRKQVESHTCTFIGGGSSILRTASFGDPVASPAGPHGVAAEAGARPTRRCTSPRKPAATVSCGSIVTPSTRTPRRKMDETSPTPQDPTYALHASDPGRAIGDAGIRWEMTIVRLHARVAELQRERDHLVAIVDILQEISSSLHFVDILQAIARKLGDAFGLDRASIFLSGEKGRGSTRRQLRGSGDPQPRRRPQSLSS